MITNHIRQVLIECGVTQEKADQIINESINRNELLKKYQKQKYYLVLCNSSQLKDLFTFLGYTPPHKKDSPAENDIREKRLYQIKINGFQATKIKNQLPEYQIRVKYPPR